MRNAIPTAIIALSLAGTAALAGAKVTVPLHLDMANRYATGSLGDVRADPDPQAFLRCEAASWPGASLAYCVACNAIDCIYSWSTDPEIIDTVRSLSSNGNVFFRWLPSGELEMVYLQTGSYFTPVQP